MAKGQRKFLLVAIDYFTKWVEAEPLVTITIAKVQGFIWKNIIEIPRVVVIDNGRQFDNHSFGTFYASYHIDHKLTSIAQPQSNEHAEVRSKNQVGKGEGLWIDEQPNVLWVYRMTTREPIR